MTSTFRLTAFMLAVTATGCLAQDGVQRHSAEPWKSIPTPSLHAFKPVAPTHIELPNGVTIFLAEDHELPFISGFIRVRGGSRDEPATKAGLTSLYGEVWRTSGSQQASGDALDDALAAKAASIETGGGGAATSMSWILPCAAPSPASYGAMTTRLRLPSVKPLRLLTDRQTHMAARKKLRLSLR
jgi:zinc protease